jgi:hypothetical protein
MFEGLTTRDARSMVLIKGVLKVMVGAYQKQKAESRRQKAENRKQKAEGRKQKGSDLPLPLGEGWGEEGLVLRRLRPFPSFPFPKGRG